MPTESALKIRSRNSPGEEWNYGLLYCALDQLARKGLLIKREGMPVPERGGRRKIYYSISQSGKRALEEAYELKEALWDGIGIPTLKKGEA